MMFLVTLRHALRNLLRNRNRTVVAVMTVASGIVAFLLAGGFIAWNFREMREATIHSQLGHLQVVRPGYFDKGIANPYAYLLPVTSGEKDFIDSLSGVTSVAPRLAFSGLASHGEVTVGFIGEGIDPQRERPISTRMTIMDGRDLDTATEKAVLVGEGLASTLGVKPGDLVVLLTTATNGSANAVEVRVSGTFSTIYKDYDDTALRLPIGVAQQLMRVRGGTSWVVLLDSTEKTSAIAETLGARLSRQAFEIVRWNDLADFYNKTVTLFSKQVNVMKVIIGLIIVLTISNIMTMSVLERTTEIGTSLAIGLRRSLVMQQFILEGVLIGVLGGIVGVVLGFLSALGISAVGIPMPPSPGMAHGFTGQIIVTHGLVVDAIALAVVTTLIASALPAWKAGRMNIVDALRYSQ